MIQGEDAEDVIVDDQLAFSNERAISRLTEMQSLEYLVEHARKHAPELLLALQEKQTALRTSNAE